MKNVCWNPSPSYALLACSLGNKIVLIASGTGDKDATEFTAMLIRNSSESYRKEMSRKSKMNDDTKDSLKETDLDDNEDNDGSSSSGKVTWSFATDEGHMSYDTTRSVRHGKPQGPRCEIALLGDVSMMQWHHKGDYIGKCSVFLLLLPYCHWWQ